MSRRLQLLAMSALLESGGGLTLCNAREWTAALCLNMSGCWWLCVACLRPSAIQLGQVVLCGMHNHCKLAMLC